MQWDAKSTPIYGRVVKVSGKIVDVQWDNAKGGWRSTNGCSPIAAKAREPNHDDA
jgi:hypothetical protein